MAVRGIRGAITVEENTKEAILKETTRLLQDMVAQNQLDLEEIASIFFSVTQDIHAEFPAVAARQLGFTDTPLLCLTEIPVPDSLPLCIRILIQVNTDKKQQDMVHSYLKKAASLRPDKTPCA